MYICTHIRARCLLFIAYSQPSSGMISPLQWEAFLVSCPLSRICAHGVSFLTVSWAMPDQGLAVVKSLVALLGVGGVQRGITV